MTDVWSVKRLLDWTTQYLADRNMENPRLNVEWLLSDTLRCKRLDLYVDFDRPLTTGELDGFKARLKRRVNQEPLQYIVGSAEFMGLTFAVNASVLIPRPDTELLVEQTLKTCVASGRDELRILDIGTGSGVISIALSHALRRRNIRAIITAIDISADAIVVAEENARTLKAESIVFAVADVFHCPPELDGRFDLVVSNPPYISDAEYDHLDAEVRNYEPPLALRAADNGLIFYRHISNLCGRLLDPAGAVRACLFEVAYDQAAAVREIMVQAGFVDVSAFRDYGGHLRVVQGHHPI